MELLSFAAAAASWVLVARQRCKKRPRAVISDRESVLLKCEKIVDGGASALQVGQHFRAKSAVATFYVRERNSFTCVFETI